MCKGQRGTAYNLYVSAIDDIVLLLRRMRPYLRLKQFQTRAVLDYLTDKISGDQLILLFNEKIHAGRNRGRIRSPPGQSRPRSIMIREARVKNIKDFRAKRKAGKADAGS